MANIPNPPFNFEFDEKFFDAVVVRAGGIRLRSKFSPLPSTKNVDYLIGDHALELKNLEVEPLNHPDRLTRFQEFLNEEKRKGTVGIDFDAVTRKVQLYGEVSQHLWERFFGNTIRNAMQKAARQIAATRQFAGQKLRGAVFILNQKAKMIDGNSLISLIEHYRLEFPEIDVAYGYNAILGLLDGAPGQIFGMATSFLINPKDVRLSRIHAVEKDHRLGSDWDG